MIRGLNPLNHQTYMEEGIRDKETIKSLYNLLLYLKYTLINLSKDFFRKILGNSKYKFQNKIPNIWLMWFNLTKME